MAHLLDFEEAQSAKAKALAAIACSRAKSANALAWNWAEEAASQATACGVKNAFELLGNNRRPNMDALENAIKSCEKNQ